MFFKRKEIWLPTWKGWLAIVATFALLIFAALRLTEPFLSPTKPVGARVLVMEGWMPEDGIRRALALNEQNHYALVITSGQEIEKGMDISQYGNYAELGAVRLVAFGFSGTNIVKVPTPKTRKDRTYHSARAVRAYLLKNTNYRSIDILSESVHARRSWLMYEKACLPEIKVGVIANHSPDFDSKHWWRSSNGVRTVMSEAISYLYARIIFRPD
jgi:hypothetical protein